MISMNIGCHFNWMFIVYNGGTWRWPGWELQVTTITISINEQHNANTCITAKTRLLEGEILCFYLWQNDQQDEGRRRECITKPDYRMKHLISIIFIMRTSWILWNVGICVPDYTTSHLTAVRTLALIQQRQFSGTAQVVTTPAAFNVYLTTLFQQERPAVTSKKGSHVCGSKCKALPEENSDSYDTLWSSGLWYHVTAILPPSAGLQSAKEVGGERNS